MISSTVSWNLVSYSYFGHELPLFPHPTHCPWKLYVSLFLACYRWASSDKFLCRIVGTESQPQSRAGWGPTFPSLVGQYRFLVPEEWQWAGVLGGKGVNALAPSAGLSAGIDIFWAIWLFGWLSFYGGGISRASCQVKHPPEAIRAFSVLDLQMVNPIWSYEL
jgi:hypothetical protein